MNKVCFYLNEGDYNRVKDITCIEDFTLRHPQLVWGWSTYFRLKEKGFDVTLSCKIPERGILVMPAIYLARLQKPPDNVLVICTLADTPPPFYMQVNITQNPLQPSAYHNFLDLPIWHHIPHWPQPGIIPRSESRGNKFDRVAFFGHRDQLALALTTEEFKRQMMQMGMQFEIREKNFADYSDVDAVIAVRDFSNEPFFYKPYTKLVNGWLAKTPVIVGPESAFRSIQKTELDFLSVKNREELLLAVVRLKNDEGLRKKMMENGLQQAKAFSEESVLQLWADFLFKDAQVYLNQWITKTRFEKRIFFVDQFVSRSYRSVKNKVKKRLQVF